MKKSSIIIGVLGVVCLSSLFSCSPSAESIEISVPDYQEFYDINTEIPVTLTVTPEDADTSSLKYHSDYGIDFDEELVTTGGTEGSYEIYVELGDLKSNVITINVVDIAAEKARIAEQEAEEERIRQEEEARRLAEEQAAKAAEEAAAREAEEQAAREAEEQRIAAAQQRESSSNSSEQSSTPPPASSSNSSLVWVDDTAKRYHKKNGCGMDNAYQVTVDQAVAMGKTPCGRCY